MDHLKAFLSLCAFFVLFSTPVGLVVGLILGFEWIESLLGGIGLGVGLVVVIAVWGMMAGRAAPSPPDRVSRNDNSDV
jgi:galactitol-specific phosphotransferase system IIC component